MASGSAWFFPPPIINGLPNTDARTQSVTPYGTSKLAIGGFASTASGASLFSFDTNLLSWSRLQNAAAVPPVSQYTDTAPSSGSGLLSIGSDGRFTHWASDGTVALSHALSTASGAFLSTYTASGGGDFGVTATGTIFNTTTGLVTGSFLATPNSAVVRDAIALNLSTGIAQAMIPASDQIGTVTRAGVFTSVGAGPSGPTILNCIAPSAGVNIAAAGTAPATQSVSGQNFFALNPANATLLLGVSNTTATVFTQQGGIYSQAWVPSAQVTGITAASSKGVWSSNGTQAFLSDATNGNLQVLNFTAGTLSISQTLTLAGIGALAAASDGISLLACQPASNDVAVFRLSGSTWSQNTSNTISITGATTIAALGASIVVGCSTGIAILTENAGVWSVSGAIHPTGFAVTALTVDNFGNIYAANATNLAVFNSAGAITGTGTMPGSSATSMVAFQAQVAVLDSTGSALRILGSDNGTTWTVRNTTVALFAVQVYQASASIFLARSIGAPLIYKWDSPYTIFNVQTGYAGVFSGATWISVSLGTDKIPSAVSFDASGNVWVACEDNSLFELNASAAIINTTVVPNYPGEATPMGVSNLAFTNSHMYAGCGMFGGLVQVS